MVLPSLSVHSIGRVGSALDPEGAVRAVPISQQNPGPLDGAEWDLPQTAGLGAQRAIPGVRKGVLGPTVLLRLHSVPRGLLCSAFSCSPGRLPSGRGRGLLGPGVLGTEPNETVASGTFLVFESTREWWGPCSCVLSV